MSYAVTIRTHEIGIRMALGARPRSVLRLIMREGVVLAGTGVAIGFISSITLTRLMETMLFGVTPTDGPTFAGMTLILGLIALVACLVPAYRATRVDPAESLRV